MELGNHNFWQTYNNDSSLQNRRMLKLMDENLKRNRIFNYLLTKYQLITTGKKKQLYSRESWETTP